MGNYENLKAAIADVITTNGNNEITGAVLRQVLQTMVSSIGENATFGGVVTPETNVGTPDQNVFYVSKTPGTYQYMGGVTVEMGEIAFFTNKNNQWNVQTVVLNENFSSFVQGDSFDVIAHDGSVEVEFNTADGRAGRFFIPAATLLNAGVMTVDDRRKLIDALVDVELEAQADKIMLNIDSRQNGYTITFPNVTTTKVGFMLPQDKEKLDGLNACIVNLGTFANAGSAEQAAAQYASNSNVKFIVYNAAGKGGIIEQNFSNSSATVQFLYYGGHRYAREVSWGAGTVGAWKDITGSERIQSLYYESNTGKIGFVDMLTGDKWGAVTLPMPAAALAMPAAELDMAAEGSIPEDITSLLNEQGLPALLQELEVEKKYSFKITNASTIYPELSPNNEIRNHIAGVVGSDVEWVGDFELKLRASANGKICVLTVYLSTAQIFTYSFPADYANIYVSTPQTLL